MRNPDEREIYGCRTCHDFRRVYANRKDVECPECAGWPEEKRADLIKAATRDRADKPSISMFDLTQEEHALVADWRQAHPNAHDMTLLTWVEGRRYDPTEDPDFLAEARQAFKKWQFLRHASVEGPTPDRIRHALDTGATDHLTKAEREVYESIRRQA